MKKGSIKEEEISLGYDQEEAYFHKVNRKLIHRKKQESSIKIVTICAACGTTFTQNPGLGKKSDFCPVCERTHSSNGDLNSNQD